MPSVVRPLQDSTTMVDVANSGALDEIETSWLKLLGRHLFDDKSSPMPKLREPQVLINEPGLFDGRLRSGDLGGLHYCHLEAPSHAFIADTLPHPGPARHMVVLQLSGTSLFTAGSREARIRPGDILFLREGGRIRVEHESRVEQIILLEPLAPDAAGRHSRHELQHCHGSGPLERMVFRWVREACGDTGWHGSGISHDVSALLARLVGQVLSSLTQAPRAEAPQALAREHIEDYIAHRLEDPDLNPTRIAEAFGCSVRTLHRAFARAGAESLERHLWRIRVEACAHALRNDAAAATSLTDLAFRYGFKSPTHFSGLFRSLYGVTPSAYKRLQRGY